MILLFTWKAQGNEFSKKLQTMRKVSYIVEHKTNIKQSIVRSQKIIIEERIPFALIRTTTTTNKFLTNKLKINTQDIYFKKPLKHFRMTFQNT